MAASLLACSICSKQPTFSDVSHLLTHVGSKGHLAQLHKLQVKSHQEIGSALQLAAYNQWYQDHNLAQLLSERLLQKELKASKKNDNKKRKTTIKAERASKESTLSPARRTAGRGRGRRRPRKVASTLIQDDSPYRAATSYPLTPLRDTPALASSPPMAVEDNAAIDPALLATPVRSTTNTKLKGTIWPGMNLFDAATPDEARRRNQKKDASVVKRMEKLSRLVIPNEVTFSSGWSLVKSRHIDDLDDASSLIEGESPLMLKPKPKPKPRKVLARVSANVTRPKRKAKASPSPKRTRRIHNARSDLKIARLPSSLNTDPFYPTYSELEDEDHDVKIMPDHLPLMKRQQDYDAFDGSPLPPKKASSHTFQHMALSQTYDIPAPRLTFPATSWLQPENQNPLFLDRRFDDFGSSTGPAALQGITEEKENVEPDVEVHEHANPLAWPSPKGREPIVDHMPGSSFGPFSGHVAAQGLADPFSFSKNPLANAFNQLSRLSEDANSPKPNRTAPYHSLRFGNNPLFNRGSLALPRI